MIQKLRRKFILVIMSVVSLILLAVFVVLIVTTQGTLEQQSREALNQSLDNKTIRNMLSDLETPDAATPGNENPDGGKGKHANMRIPAFTLLLSPEGEILGKRGAQFLLDEFTEEQLRAISQAAAAAQPESGILADYHLRFLKQTVDAGTMIAYVDTGADSATLTQLIQNSLFIGIGTLLLFFIISIFIARWAVRPVERAWIQQKQFVGDASHELKTPLTVILSNVDMLLTHPEKQEPRWAENIKAESVRMKRLTEELLSLARSEDTAQNYVFSSVDFSYLVTESVLLFEPTAFECGKELEYHIAEHLSVMGHAGTLSQVVSILLDNAIKYALPDSTVHIALKQTGKQAKLLVSNKGSIPAEQLPHLFERFYRGDASRQEDGGHGLGLAIAQNIVSLHHGKIWAESEDGDTLFTLLLPLYREGS